MHIIGLSERASGVAQDEADGITFLNQMIEVLGFAGERLLQKPEEVIVRRPLIVVSELDMVAPAGGCIFDYQAEIAVLKPVFVHDLAIHILVPEYVQN